MLAGSPGARSQPWAITSVPKPSPGAFLGKNNPEVKGMWGRGGRKHGVEGSRQGGRVQGRLLCSGGQWECGAVEKVGKQKVRYRRIKPASRQAGTGRGEGTPHTFTGRTWLKNYPHAPKSLPSKATAAPASPREVPAAGAPTATHLG